MTTVPTPSPDPAAGRTPAVGRPSLLIGHADRTRTQERLSRAVGLGELTLDEFDDRLQAALGARTDADLQRLLVDLPSATADLAGVPAAWTPPSSPQMSPSNQVSGAAGTDVRRRPAPPMPRTLPVDPWVRWAALAALMIVVWIAIGIPTGAWYPWPIWPILGTATCAIRQSVGHARIGRAGIGT